LTINTLIPIDFSSVVTIVLVLDVPVLLLDVFVLLPDALVLLSDVFVLLSDVFVLLSDVFVLLSDVALDDVVELDEVQGDVELQHLNPSGNVVQNPSPQF